MFTSSHVFKLQHTSARGGHCGDGIHHLYAHVLHGGGVVGGAAWCLGSVVVRAAGCSRVVWARWDWDLALYLALFVTKAFFKYTHAGRGNI